MITDVAGDPADPAVVFLHAGIHARQFWEASARNLVDAGHHVVSLDLRDYSDGDWAPGGDYGMQAMTDDLLSVLRQLPSKPALIGASLGCLVALQAVAGSSAQIASSLILVDLPPGLVAEDLAAARLINLPTFLVQGVLGDPAGEEAARLLQTRIPNAAYVNLANMGGEASGDRNGIFNAALLDFLNQCISLGQPT